MLYVGRQQPNIVHLTLRSINAVLISERNALDGDAEEQEDDEQDRRERGADVRGVRVHQEQLSKPL